MAAAKSKDYVKTDSGKFVPYARPGGGGGGGGAVTGASWTGGGTINDRSGKLYFSTTKGNWQCSASVVDDGSTSNTYSVILTAGHCTYDAAEGGWSTNVQFIPNFDAAPFACGSTMYGCWTGATRLGVNLSFFNEGGFGSSESVRVDYGFMQLGLGGKSGTAELDNVVGGYGFRTTAADFSATEWAFGYPAAGKYKGKDLTYCKGSAVEDPYGDPTWGIACNMTGGSSGGPWLVNTTNPGSVTAPGVLSSLNSYGYQGLTYMFGPIFDGQTIAVAGDTGDGTATNGVTKLSTP
jgi:V8-like Glu-specific endopeptidase